MNIMKNIVSPPLDLHTLLCAIASSRATLEMFPNFVLILDEMFECYDFVDNTTADLLDHASELMMTVRVSLPIMCALTDRPADVPMRDLDMHDTPLHAYVTPNDLDAIQRELHDQTNPFLHMLSLINTFLINTSPDYINDLLIPDENAVNA